LDINVWGGEELHKDWDGTSVDKLLSVVICDVYQLLSLLRVISTRDTDLNVSYSAKPR